MSSAKVGTFDAVFFRSCFRERCFLFFSGANLGWLILIVCG